MDDEVVQNIMYNDNIACWEDIEALSNSSLPRIPQSHLFVSVAGSKSGAKAGGGLFGAAPAGGPGLFGAPAVDDSSKV